MKIVAVIFMLLAAFEEVTGIYFLVKGQSYFMSYLFAALYSIAGFVLLGVNKLYEIYNYLKGESSGKQ